MSAEPSTSLLEQFETHYDAILRFLTHWLGSASLAADVAQDTWVRLRVKDHLPPVSSPRTYFIQTARHVAIDRLRRESWKIGTEVPVPPDLPADLPEPPLLLDRQQRLARLERAITTLPPRCREVFLLHKFDGLTQREIALKLGISRSMVEKHITRALAHCRDAVDDDER